MQVEYGSIWFQSYRNTTVYCNMVLYWYSAALHCNYKQKSWPIAVANRTVEQYDVDTLFAPRLHSSRWGILDTKTKGIIVQWVFSGISRFDVKTTIGQLPRGNYSQIPRSMLQQVRIDSPAMSLRASAEFFVDRLDPGDREALATTMQLLHNKCITFGSTCSGTDIIIPVMQHTFQTLSRMFNVASHAPDTLL